MTNDDLVEKQHDTTTTSTNMDILHIGKAETYTLLHSTDTENANHSHDISSWISKKNAEFLCRPLAHTINAELEHETFQVLWKKTEIQAINTKEEVSTRSL